jgi:carboxylesterase type B
VHQQIDAFGGDRERITIAGCSSGGQSVLDHLYNERSSKAFQQAIVLSAPSGIPYLKKEQANAQVRHWNLFICNF